MADNIDPNDELVALGDEAVAAALRMRRDTLPPIPPYQEDEEIGELPGVINPADWCNAKVPARRYIMDGWIVRGACGLLTGPEGVGKSLLAQQMATCAAAYVPFLGMDLARVPAVYITCEDPAEELWRRQVDINAALGIQMGILDDRLRLVSLKGVIGNELGTFSSDGRLHVGQRYRQIENLCRDFGAGLVFLDNAAHFFPGNENSRHDVAAFLGLGEKLGETIDGAAIFLAHPNKQHSQGNKEGNEYSGSTGWSAHVRNRLFLDWADKDAQGNYLGEDGRILRKSKANYGRQGEEIACRWHQWAFVREEDIPVSQRAELAEVARANGENAAFLRCLTKATDQQENVSHASSASNYAPKVFAKMAIGKGYDVPAFERAMRRLIDLGTILPNEKVFKYPANRTWATGLKFADESAQRLAQSLHKAVHEGCTEANGEPAENLHEGCTEAHKRGSLYTTYKGEGALDAPPLPLGTEVDAQP